MRKIVFSHTFTGREDRSERRCPMFETHTNPDYDAIMLKARQLRAEAMRDLVSSLISVFRRKKHIGAVYA